MTDAPPSSSRWLAALRLIAWAAFAAVIAWQATGDVQFSPDSMHYVDIARTIAREGRIATYHLSLNSAQVPDPSLPWPPLYPLLLSGPLKAGCDTGMAVRIIDILSLVATGLLGARLCCRLSGRGVHGLCVVLLVLLGVRMEIFGFAWSEPPFVALVLAFLLSCVLHIQTGSRLALALAAVFGGGAFMTRYAGIVVAPVGFLALLQRHLHAENPHRRTRLFANTLLFGGLFAAASGPWLLRNVLMDGRLFGPEAPPSPNTLNMNLVRTWEAIRAQVPLALAALVVALGFYLILLWRRQRRLDLRQRITDPRTSPVWFVVLYAALLITHSTLRQIDAIDTRLLSPVFPPLAILALAAMYKFLRDHSSEHAARVVAGLCALSIAVSAGLARLPPKPPRPYRGPLVREYRTQSPPNVDWIAANTETNALIIARGAWGYRFFTGRPVLECGYPATPNLSKEGIDRFLAAHPNRFQAVYLSDGGLSDAYRESPMVLPPSEGGPIRKLLPTADPQE